MEDCPSNTRYLPADFNLRNLATIAYAATLWNASNIAPFFDKANRKSGFCGNHPMSEHYEHIREVIKETEKTFKSANFPSKISDLILHALKMMGQRIALWSEYAQHVLKIKKKAIPTVFWTAHGTVDEGKILLNSKANRDDLIPPLEAVYFTVCSSVSVDYIKLEWKKILLFCEILSREDQSFSAFSWYRKFKFISCSVIFLEKLELSQLFPSQTQYFKKYKYPEKENMFWLSMEEGCPEAVRYYWSLMDDLEKRALIHDAADFSLLKYRAKEIHDSFRVEPVEPEERTYLEFQKSVIIPLHTSKCFADLLIFFITRMTDHELSHYLNTLKEKLNRRDDILIIFEVIMCHCPLEEFLPLAFELALTYCEVKNDYKILISKLLGEVFRDKRFGFLIDPIFFEKLIKGLREKFGTHNYWVECHETPLLKKIYNNFDLKDLKIIFDDCPAEHKKELITFGEAVFKRLFHNQQFQLLKSFKDDILQSEDECNWFMEICFGFAGGVLSIRRTDVMDKLVEVFYSTPEIYKNDISNQHRILQICAELICKRRIHAADTAIRWMFGSDQGKQNFVKNHLIKDMSWVWHIRKQKQAFAFELEPYVSFKEHLSKFVMWLLESPDEFSQFKSGQLASQFALKNLLAALLELEVDSDGKRRGSEIFKIFEEFLQFCLIPENVEILKKEIRREIDEWILFLSGKCCLHFADDFLTWIFESREKKNEAVHKFLKRRRSDVTFTENTISNWAKCNQQVLSFWNETADANLVNFAEKLQHSRKLEDPKYFENDCGYIYADPRA